jgi:hypothetical protein
MAELCFLLNVLAMCPELHDCIIEVIVEGSRDRLTEAFSARTLLLLQGCFELGTKFDNVNICLNDSLCQSWVVFRAK